MAELGESGNPTDLIPGNPAAIEENAVAIRGRADSMELAGTGLRRIDTGDYWTGDAANNFRDVFSYEPPRWMSAADSFHKASGTLTVFADLLRWAQGQAQEAIHTWDAAQDATRTAVQAHNAAVTQANALNVANAAAGSNTRIEVSPFVDPGVEGREAAQGMLQSARTQLKAAGDHAAEALSLATQDAPEAPKKPGGGIGHFFSEIGSGAWESVTGLNDLVNKLSPQRIGYDPIGYGNDLKTMAAGLGSAVTHPADFGKQLIDLDTWKESPGRAIGHLVPDAVAAAATGGTGAIAKRVGVGTAEAAEKQVAEETIEAAGKDLAEKSANNGPSLAVKYKDSWTPAQRAEMDNKVAAFNQAVDNGGFARTAVVPRDPAVRAEFLESIGLDRSPPGTHVDHTRDLQAGGKDAVNNMGILDASVNTSFGSQLRGLMAQYPPGTVFSAVELLRQ